MKTFCHLTLLILVACVMPAVAYADAPQTGPQAPPHLKAKLVAKYKKIQEVTSTLYMTPNGPKGHVNIIGELMPDQVSPVEGEHAWERGMARGFLEQEASTFGIANMDELQERLVATSDGYYGQITHVHFHKVVNGYILENSRINISVDAIRNISGVIADVVPSPPELYEATKRVKLDENEIRKIIEMNLRVGSLKPELSFKTIEVFATDVSPYVVYIAVVALKGVLGDSVYRIDAFTGEILNISKALISNRSNN